jgi:uncharacterized tellurite resistance protein B-like protein
MDKPGTHNIQNGFMWLIIGTVLTVGTFAVFDWAGGFLFYGAIFVGVIQTVVGIGQRVQYELMPEEKRARKRASASMATLLRCMAIAANADGHVHDTELQTMAIICNRLLGFAPTLDELREITNRVGMGGSDPEEFIASLGTQLPVDERYLIAKACYLVVAADTNVSDQERKALTIVINGLRIRQQDVYEDLERSGILRPQTV